MTGFCRIVFGTRAGRVRQVIATPEHAARLLRIGFFTMNENGAEVAAISGRETTSFADGVKKTGLKIE